MSALSDKVRNLPATPGVYLFKDARGRVLYVGKAKSLQHRVRSYLTGDNAHGRLEELMGAAADLDSILTDTEVEALLLESTLVRQHKPPFNTMLKDDKSFPYVRISMQEEFPRLSVTRQVRQDGARYLGPYTDVKNLRRTLREIRRVFPIRTCRNFEDYRRKNRPCLYYHIKRCMGPCYTRADVATADYRAMCEKLVWFLTGRDVDVVGRLKEEMEAAAESREYERAAQRRDQLRLLERARVPQKVVDLHGRETDVVGVARHGRRAAIAVLLLRNGRIVGKESRILDRLDRPDEADVLRAFLMQRYLGTARPPHRIVVSRAPEDREVLAAALEQRAAHRVQLDVPSRGRAKRLVETAERNAAHALEDLEARRAGRRARFSPEVIELQKKLDLAVPPYRMICFDISNLGPDSAVAAVVASEDGRPRKALYRRMRMRRPGPDDFAMMAEAIERYWTRVESGEWPRPDLVMVDGGEGQVSAARQVLDSVASEFVPLIGLAKREETVIRETKRPLRLPRRSAALRALQRLRDEAHRFGLDYHRKLRSRTRMKSDLDEIPGVGPARRAALLRAFGSVAALRSADAEEIVRRAHVPATLADRVVAHLAGDGSRRSA